MKKFLYIPLSFVYSLLQNSALKEETYADWEKSHPESIAVKEDKGEIILKVLLQQRGTENPNKNQKAEEYNNIKQGIQQELNPSNGIEKGIKRNKQKKSFEERYPELDYDENFGVRNW